MARNGSGTYVVYTPGNPVVTGTTISSTAFNNTINDIATALTGSISADGQTPITANIPMNSHKLTGLAAPTVAGDALSYGGVVAGSTGAFTSSALGTQVIATNGGTTTLTSTSPYYTVFTGTFVQTLVLPDATTLTVGQQYGIDNDGSLAITVKTNGGATLWTIASGCDLYLTLTAQATAVGTWETDYQGAQLATGKTLVVNNSVTVNGTDGTTMTLPAVSGTLATLAGSETLTNKALNGTLGATTPSTVVATTITSNGATTLAGGNTTIKASSQLLLENAAGNDTYGAYNAGSTGTSTYSFRYSGVDRVIFDASGNVGIGVTPSAWLVYKAIQVGNTSFSTSSASGTTAYITGNGYFNGTNWIYQANDYASRYACLYGSGTHAWFTAPSGTAGNAITFTQAMTLDASGGLKTLNTIGVGNATPSTSGAGITFPATQSASTDANTLDDYEEGTFTPTGLDQSGHAFPSYTTQVGFYTKVGNLVTIRLRMRTNGSTAGMTTTQMLKIGGLPFSVIDTQGSLLLATTVGLVALAPSVYLNVVAYNAGSGGTALDIYAIGGDVVTPYGETQFTVANFEGGSGAYINISGTYFTS